METLGFSTLQLYYDATADQFVLTDGVTPIDLPSEIMPGDRLTFCISQSSTDRTLLLFNARTGVTLKASAALTPIGTIINFTTASVGYPTAPGTMANLEFKNVALTKKDFANIANGRVPPGHQPFRELVPGDYQFQNAYIWLAARVVDRSVNVAISECIVRIDVPDLKQTGTKTMLAAGASVTFATPYTNIPDLVVTPVTAAVPCVPRVTALSTTGFTVQLIDLVGSGVAGQASWTANGY
jgi:hypothetical protein